MIDRDPVQCILVSICFDHKIAVRSLLLLSVTTCHWLTSKAPK